MDALSLFHRYRDDVYRLAVNDTHNAQEAEDVCQTVFLKLLEQEKLTLGKEKARLMQVTANECRRLLRSSWWKQAPAKTPPAPQNTADEAVRAMRELPSKYRVVIYLHYYEEYTTDEIGQLLKIPARLVTIRLARGRERLKQILKEGWMMERRLVKACDHMIMPDDCSRHIEQALERQFRSAEKETRKGTMAVSQTSQRNWWLIAAGIVCLVLALSVGGTFLCLNFALSETAVVQEPIFQTTEDSSQSFTLSEDGKTMTITGDTEYPPEGLVKINWQPKAP